MSSKKCLKCQADLGKQNGYTFSCNHIMCEICLFSKLKNNFSIADWKNNFQDINCKCLNGQFRLTEQALDKLFSSKKTQKKINLKCAEHQADIQYYCGTCKKEICDKCKTSVHLYHKWVGIDDFKKNISSQYSLIMKGKSDASLGEYLKKQKKKVEEQINNSFSILSKKIKKIITQATAISERLEKEKNEKLKKFKSYCNIIEKFFSLAYRDTVDIKNRNVCDIKYLLKLKYDFVKINFDDRASASLCDKVNANLENIERVFSSGLKEIFKTDFVFKRIHLQTIEFHSSKKDFTDCSNMIKTKYPVGNIIQLNEESIAFSSGSVYSDSNDNSLQVFNLKQSKFKSFEFGNKNSISCLVLLNTNRIALGSYDKSIKVIGANDFKSLFDLAGHQGPVFSIVEVSNEVIASCGGDSKVIIWDLVKKAIVSSISSHSDVLYTLSFNNKKGYLFSAGGDKVIRIWESAKKFKSLKELSGHNGTIYSLCLLFDGNIASGSKDHTIRIWDLKSFSCMSELHQHKGAIFVVKELIDHRIISGSYDKTIRIWDLNKMSCSNVIKGNDSAILAICITAQGKMISGSKNNVIKIYN